jgi:probable HAF family extracellular repeat protein
MLGGDFSEAHDNNHSTQVVGVFNLSDNTYRAFLWEAGTGMQSLCVLPGTNAIYASEINDSGLVVGQG